MEQNTGSQMEPSKKSFFLFQKWFISGGGGYSTLSWVRMCGPMFRPPPYN